MTKDFTAAKNKTDLYLHKTSWLGLENDLTEIASTEYPPAKILNSRYDHIYHLHASVQFLLKNDEKILEEFFSDREVLNKIYNLYEQSIPPVEAQISAIEEIKRGLRNDDKDIISVIYEHGLTKKLTNFIEEKYLQLLQKYSNENPEDKVAKYVLAFLLLGNLESEKKGLKILDNLNIENYAPAQYLLGQHFLSDIENIEKSQSYFEKAAENNHIQAINERGLYHFKKANINEASKYFEKAAKENSDDAKFYLGLCNILTKDKKGAKALFEEIKDKNPNAAYFLLGENFEKIYNSCVKEHPSFNPEFLTNFLLSLTPFQRNNLLNSALEQPKFSIEAQTEKGNLQDWVDRQLPIFKMNLLKKENSIEYLEDFFDSKQMHEISRKTRNGESLTDLEKALIEKKTEIEKKISSGKNLTEFQKCFHKLISKQNLTTANSFEETASKEKQTIQETSEKVQLPRTPKTSTQTTEEKVSNQVSSYSNSYNSVYD